MIHLFLNCSAASAGGGLTYLQNVVTQLAARNDVRATVAANPELRPQMGDLPNVSWVNLGSGRGAVHRFWQEQTLLPKLVRSSGADVLISAGNFALRKSPVPQILLSGNSLYTSADFARDLRSRGEYRLRLENYVKGLVARRSVGWADWTVAPTQAFAEDLHRWTGAPVTAIHHGFDHDAFFRSSDQLPQDLQQKLVSSGKGCLRLLFVSHYNYYRNFETLIRAIPMLRERLGSRNVELFLTCRLNSKENPGAYRAEPAAALVRQLGVADQLVELGTIPYKLLHHVYRACDIYVTPAYTETFAHPLVEAMASGLPVVASDLAVHHEVCGKAALYFSRFSPEDLANQVLRIANSSALGREMKDSGEKRSRDFSWSRHLDELVALASQLLNKERWQGYVHRNISG
jgi:glycosyltransferase involved in cell wall biosynthesis